MRTESEIWHVVVAMAISFCLLGAASERAEPAHEFCDISAEQGGMQFPVDQLDRSTRCLLGAIIHDHTTAGVVGPSHTPIPNQLYQYLVDRPPLIALLLEKFSLATYQFKQEGPNRCSFNDGEGVQGLLTLVYQDATNRLYYLDGYHEGSVFPRIYAKAAVFMKILPDTTSAGSPAVRTTLVSYIQLDDSLMAGLIHVLRPLVGGAMTRKLTQGFEITNKLGALIAQDPDRVIQEVASLPGLSPANAQSFIAVLRLVPPPAAVPSQTAATR